LKVLNAEDAGAIGVIIHNCEPGAEGCSTSNPGEGIISMGPGAVGDDVTIPSTFIQQSNGLLFAANAPGVEGFVQLIPINRDSDLDNGVIIHEYGHGVSNRLTGGPSNASCLENEEQMGEGWSDYLGLIMTMREGDTPGQGRGIGTYVEFQETDGPGIRPHPYSTDMTVNPHTYNDIALESVPHGVGSVWAAMLWDMTWSLIEQEGFDPDLINGTGGNNIALQLVMDGMKLQPCSPGFVDGRDAILEADTLLNDGAYSDRIWIAFANRGLGYSADQGLSTSRSDGSEAFDLPPGVTVANEEEALPNGYALSAAYPNPFSDRAQITLEVAEAQDVRVAVYDVMGREVTRLHDGPLAAGARARFELDGGALASGVYLVRVTGAAFAETRRVTLLR
ncbi:MAG: M36 family metallopeptidase, partial [Gemmatimonadota bacterium]|nr:M36 family metallopeptidase [Gemmatimonadota bacterium]